MKYMYTVHVIIHNLIKYLTHAMRKEIESRAGPLPQLDVDRPAELERGDEEGEPALPVPLAAVREGRQRQEGCADED